MKRLVGLMTCVVLFTMILSPVSAKGVSTTQEEQFEVLKIYDPLTEGRLNASEIKKLDEIIATTEIVDNLTGETEQYESTEKLFTKTRQLLNTRSGEVIDEYSVASSALFTLSGNGTDGAIAVRAYTTLTFTLHGEHSDYVKMDKVDYRWTKLDSQVTVSDKEIKIFQMGPGLNGGGQLNNGTWDASADGYIITRDLGWAPVLRNGLGYSFGSQMTATIKQGSTRSWTMKFNLSY